MMEFPTEPCMEYRQEPASAHGYDNEQDEYLGMRQHIQMMMENSQPANICDMLLILANICDYRALGAASSQPVSDWYNNMSAICRGSMIALERLEPSARPNIKLENQMLYWPEFEVSH